MHLRQDRDETLRQAQDLWQYRDKLEDLWRPRTFMYSWQLKTSFAIYGNSRQVCVDEDNSETSSMYLWHLETRSRFMTPSRQARVYMTSRQARRFMSPRDKLEYLWPRDKLAYLWQSRQVAFMTPRGKLKDLWHLGTAQRFKENSTNSKIWGNLETSQDLWHLETKLEDDETDKLEGYDNSETVFPCIYDNLETSRCIYDNSRQAWCLMTTQDKLAYLWHLETSS
jgi:hypothetical protein